MLLIPTATLVVLVLGALSVDLAVVHLAQRQAFAAASAAANDAATAGLDPTALHGGDGPRLDADRARRAAAASLAGESALDPTATPEVRIEGTTVTVVVRFEVDYVFARGIPGAADGTTVRATASADAVER
jgi:hypothetical protein